MTLVMASLIPILGGLSRKRSYSISPRKHDHLPKVVSSSQSIQTPKRPRYTPHTPTRNATQVATPKRMHSDQQRTDQIASHQSPTAPTPASIPAPGFELRACLRDFSEQENIDLMQFASALHAEDFTPDIIALADECASQTIRSITKVTSGRLMKLKLFCKKWQTDYERRINYTTYGLE
jgi:hypothetical protein